MSLVPASDKVQFDFRFDPQPKIHEEKISVRRGLVHQFAESYAPQQQLLGISLYPVERAGRSGSEVFYLDLKFDGFAFPKRLIAKFQNIKDTDREIDGAHNADMAQFCSQYNVCKNVEKDLGIVVYNLAASKDHVEFRGFFLDRANPDESCAEALRSIFKLVGQYPNTAIPAKNLIEDFHRYVNRKTRPLQRLAALADVAPAQQGFGHVALSIQSTYERIESNLNFQVQPYIVHGDLHARNLMLSKSDPGKTELIDFGWVHSGHPAKDFVLMECTLKYMLLPELLQKSRDSVAGRLYINTRSFETFERFLCEHTFSLPPVEEMISKVFDDIETPPHQIEALSRVYLCLIEIRKAAGEVLCSYCKHHCTANVPPEQHYFASFFLVTIGLMGLIEVDQLWAMIGLQTVGNTL